jgi:ABC-type lipoprotein release transport system permease subunit
MTTYLLAEIQHRFGRALGSLIGVALGVALFMALIAAGNGFRAAARQPLAGIGADILISRPDNAVGAAAQTTRGLCRMRRKISGLIDINNSGFLDALNPADIYLPTSDIPPKKDMTFVTCQFPCVY